MHIPFSNTVIFSGLFSAMVVLLICDILFDQLRRRRFVTCDKHDDVTRPCGLCHYDFVPSNPVDEFCAAYRGVAPSKESRTVRSKFEDGMICITCRMKPR